MKKIGIKSLLFFILLFSYGQVSSQVFQEWAARYDGTSHSFDGARCIAVDNAGFVYLGGSGFQTGTSRDMVTIKLTPSGDTAWVRTYHGNINGGDYIFGLALDNVGNVYVTGRTDDGGTAGSHYTTLKYNPSGVLLWAAIYDGTASGTDEANAIIVDNLGNVYVTGKSPGTGTNLDIVTVKYNSAGVQQWVMRYNGTANSSDVASSIALTSAGDVIVAGTSWNTGKGYDITLISYSASGTQQWVRTYNNPVVNGGDFGKALAVDALDNIIVTGSVDNGALLFTDYITIKYSSAGTQQWVAMYNGSGSISDEANDVDLDPAGNIYVTGKSMSGASNMDFTTIKYSPAGVQQWIQTYNGPGNGYDEAAAIEVDPSGNAYVGGPSVSALNDTNYTTIRYNANGTQKWILNYNGPANRPDFLRALALDNANHVYVTGESFGTTTNFDFATVKYYQCNLTVNAGNDTTIIFGYGTHTASLKAVTAGGMAPIHYEWSTGDTTQTIIVSPVQTTTYIVNVTDAKNCTAVDTVVVNVVSVMCTDRKVLICHKGQTLCIDSNAVKAHLNHGDQLGPCTILDAVKEATLYGNYPNPFNPVTSISFDIPLASHVKLIIYDNIGREVSSLVDGYLEAGRHKFNWDASNFASGIYFYKLVTNGFEQTKKMVLIK